MAVENGECGPNALRFHACSPWSGLLSNWQSQCMFGAMNRSSPAHPPLFFSLACRPAGLRWSSRGCACGWPLSTRCSWTERTQRGGRTRRGRRSARSSWSGVVHARGTVAWGGCWGSFAPGCMQGACWSCWLHVTGAGVGQRMRTGRSRAFFHWMEQAAGAAGRVDHLGRLCHPAPCRVACNWP